MLEVVIARGPLEIVFGPHHDVSASDVQQGLDACLVVVSASAAIPCQPIRGAASSGHWVRPGMVCLRAQDRPIRDIKPDMEDAARWLNTFFTRTTASLTLEFATERDGTPRLIVPKRAVVSSSPRRRGSIFGGKGGGGADAFMASAAGSAASMFSVRVAGKPVQLILGTVGVQLMTIQKKGAPLTTTDPYGQIVETFTDEVNTGHVVTWKLKDGSKTSCSASKIDCDNICLEVMIKMQEMSTARRRERAGAVRSAFEALTDSDADSSSSSSSSSSNEEQESSEDEDVQRREKRKERYTKAKTNSSGMMGIVTDDGAGTGIGSDSRTSSARQLRRKNISFDHNVRISTDHLQLSGSRTSGRTNGKDNDKVGALLNKSMSVSTNALQNPKSESEQQTAKKVKSILRVSSTDSQNSISGDFENRPVEPEGESPVLTALRQLTTAELREHATRVGFTTADIARVIRAGE